MTTNRNDIGICWQSLQRADTAAEQAFALDALQDALPGASDPSALDAIGDDAWRNWAAAFWDWNQEQSVRAERAARQVDRAVQRARRAAKRGQGTAVILVHPELLQVATDGLVARSLAEQYIDQSHYPDTDSQRTDQLAELRTWFVKLENRLRGLPPLTTAAQAAFAKGIWRFYQWRYAEAVDDFQAMLESAEMWNNQAAMSEARLWLALTLDLLGRGEEAIDYLHRAIRSQRGSASRRCPRATRLACLLRAHRARLCRHLHAKDPAYHELAVDDLDHAEDLARQLQDDVLLAMVHDFRGDLLLAEDRRADARQAFDTAADLVRRTGNIRAYGYVQYSRAKCLLAGVHPIRQGLPKRQHESLLAHAAAAEKAFQRVGDQIGVSMTLLLRAQAEMRTNLSESLELLAGARRQLRRYGPRRHYALALFRSAELVITNLRRVREVRNEDPMPYLRGALGLVQRLSMSDRLALFREGLKQLPVDEWIDVLLQFTGRPEPAEIEAETLGRVKAGAAMLAHDYGNLLQSASDKLAALAARETSSQSQISKVVATVHRLTENLRTEINSLAGQEALGVAVRPQAVPLASLVHDLVDQFNVVAHVHVDTQIPPDLPDIKADPALLRRVLFNLLINAQRAIQRDQPTRSKVTVRAALQPGKVPGVTYVELTIIDTAGGVPEAARQELFQRGKSRFRGGSGLGLDFCKKAMRAMKGDVYLKNHGGDSAGATFAVRLNVARRASAKKRRPK